MKIFTPLRLIAVLSALPLMVGCRTMGPTTTIEIPTEESPQDQALSKLVRDRLIAYKKLDLTDIIVASKRGTVYLSGIVKSLEARQQAIKIAWEVPGVQSVVNSLDLQR